MDASELSVSSPGVHTDIYICFPLFFSAVFFFFCFFVFLFLEILDVDFSFQRYGIQ